MKHTLIQFISIIGLTCAMGWAALSQRDITDSHGEYHCNPKALSENEICLADVQEGALFIDARSRAEWEKSSFRHALLWNLDASENQKKFESDAVLQIANAEQVIVYCGSHSCGLSKEVAKRIRGLGLEVEVRTLAGGWDAIKDSNKAH